ncbi:MAG: hypothetical protein HQK55_09845, partial [Deltaproteobacteria bacterium]|nr:hypothetical protein [Deltaproteobacteria bacterium]
MKRKPRLGIASKVLVGLGLISLVMILSAVLLILAFDRFTLAFREVTDRKLPALIATSQLVRESERLQAMAPDVIVAENQFIREALSKEINDTTRRWNDLAFSQTTAPSQP